MDEEPAGAADYDGEEDKRQEQTEKPTSDKAHHIPTGELLGSRA
jgi:hypothetical protein